MVKNYLLNLFESEASDSSLLTENGRRIKHKPLKNGRECTSSLEYIKIYIGLVKILVRRSNCLCSNCLCSNCLRCDCRCCNRRRSKHLRCNCRCCNRGCSNRLRCHDVTGDGRLETSPGMYGRRCRATETARNVAGDVLPEVTGNGNGPKCRRRGTAGGDEQRKWPKTSPERAAGGDGRRKRSETSPKRYCRR